jgi:hypothetical protein
MMLSMAVLLVPILVIGALLRACGSSEPTVVDPAPAIDAARAAALFPVVVPRGLDDWRPVQATFRRPSPGVGTLRLGYLTPAGGQVLLIVSNETASDLLARELGDAVEPEGELTINGGAWASSVVRGDERALVHAETARTIIVVGHASRDELTSLAAALREARGD